MDPLSNLNYDFVDVEEEEVWTEKKPKKADHIRVNRGFYNHHGIYISNKEVIHYNSRDDNGDNLLNATVISTTLNEFLKGGVCEVKTYNDEELNDLFSADSIVNYARSCLDEGGYNLVFNNCEHFANKCTLGQHRSRQVERVFKTVERGVKMGWLSKFGSAVIGILSSSSKRTTHNYNYDPDKVKVEELANDRVKLQKEADLDVMEMNARLEAAIMEAGARAMDMKAKILINMMRDLNTIAEERRVIIEKGSIETVLQIETLYSKLEEKMENDSRDFDKRIIDMEAELSKFEKDSDSYIRFGKRIEKLSDKQLEMWSESIKNLHERQKTVIESSMRMKEDINKHIAEIVEQKMKLVEHKSQNQISTTKQLENSNKDLEDIDDGKNDKV